MKRDIYIAIMAAAAHGRGVHLSADEIFELSLDDAIAKRAANGLAEDEPDEWAQVNPRRLNRVAANRTLAPSER